MAVELIQISGVTNHHQLVWQIRALQINGRNLVLGPLVEWERKSPGVETCHKLKLIYEQQS
jgi:hypothetical protein